MSEVNVGGIEIVDFTILGSAGAKKLNINDIVLEFNIYENIEQPFMSADFVVNDSLSLTTRMPIVGQELIQVEFRVPVIGMKEKPFKKIFRIFSIKNFDVNKKQRNSKYILRCYEPAYFRNLTTKVQKSYANMNVSEMVEKLSKDYLGLKTSEIKTEKTDGKLTLVVPNLHPDEAIISLMSRYARSEKYGDVSNYYFYSHQGGYKFTTLENLMDYKTRQSESKDFHIDTLTLKDKNLPNQFTTNSETTPNVGKTENTPTSVEGVTTNTSQRKPESFLRINDIKIVNKMNIEDGLKNGMFDNTVMWINPSLSLFEKKVYKYTDDFKKFKVLCENVGFKVIDDEMDTTKEFKNLKGKSKEFYIITNKGDRTNQVSEDKRYTFLNYNKASENMMNSIIINLTVPGDNTRTIGDIINLKIPEFGATDDIMGELDKFISGYYLVTAVRHIHSVDQGYSCILRCMKNCFDSSIQDRLTEIFDGKSATVERLPNEPEPRQIIESAA